jgi:hypothetical protein
VGNEAGPHRIRLPDGAAEGLMMKLEKAAAIVPVVRIGKLA